jgi:hypothetical protein
LWPDFPPTTCQNGKKYLPNDHIIY